MKSSDQPKKAFSLVELLVSITVLAVLLTITVMVLNLAQKTWRSSKNRMAQYRDSRVAFEMLTRNLGQATLNTYWDYLYPSTKTNKPPAPVGGVFEAPSRYMRQSELHFTTGVASALVNEATAANFPGDAIFFVAPLGFTVTDEYRPLTNLLNARGYFVAFGDDAAQKPPFVTTPTRNRYRLFEYRPPTENLRIYETDSAGVTKLANATTRNHWFDDANPYATGNGGSTYKFTRPVADNIIALIVSPRRSLSSGEREDKAFEMAPRYTYDSYEIQNPGAPDVVSGVNPDGTRHLLPPLVQVTLIAMDESSAQRLEDMHGTRPPPEITAALSGKFSSVADYEADIAAVSQSLSNAHIGFKIFNTTIPLRSSKWDGRVK